MTPLQACLKEADSLIGPSKRSIFDPIRIYVKTAEGQEQRRVFVLVDAAVRIIAPMALERDLPEEAAILRALPEIVDRETAHVAVAAADHADNWAADFAADAASNAAFAAASAARAAASAAHPAHNAYDAAYDVARVAVEAAQHHTARQDDRPWLALRDAMLRAACLDGVCCIHPECRGKDEEGVEGCSLMYPDFGRACLIEADPLGVRKNPTESNAFVSVIGVAAAGALLGWGLSKLMSKPENVSKDDLDTQLKLY